MLYNLEANREGDTRQIGVFKSMTEAKAKVEAMEADGTWPEGFDAMLAGKQDEEPVKFWMLVDEWEKL